MKQVAHGRRSYVLVVLGLLGCLWSQCTYGATEVVVNLDTDAPTSRALTITVTAHNGSSDAASAQSMHTWVRGGSTGTITLPASFAVTPPSDGDTNSPVTLVVDATLAPGPAGEPALAFQRIARFTFSLHTTTDLGIFLSMSCGQLTTGCMNVSGSQCTVSEFCEEQGETCGDQGQCVSQMVMPQPMNGPEASVPDIATDASDRPTDTVITEATVDAVIQDAAMDSMGPDVADVTVDPMPPRPIAPLSSSIVTSQQPTLRWALASGADGAQVQLCRDRAMTMGCQTLQAPAGASTAMPSAALQPGVWFWQLRGQSGTSVGTMASPVWQFNVGARSAPLQSSYGSRYDPNGDGYEDLLIAASSMNLVHYFAGGTGGVPMTPTATIMGPAGAGGFGSAVASAGDVNGDGLVDTIIGDPGDTGGSRAYVYLSTGMETLWSGSPTALTVPSGPSGVGGTVAGIGDANGDGYGDVVVSGAFVGHAYVFYGNANGISTTPDVTLSPPDTTGGFYGVSVAGGDVNGDGLGDVLVGERGYGINAGRLNVYLGGIDGVSGSPSMSVLGPDGQGSFCTQVISSAGDVDGDGLMDVVVGCEDGANYAGIVHVFRGTSGGLETTPSFTYTAPVAGTYLSQSSCPAGDVNGDGFSDIVVGSDPPIASIGMALVFLGSSTGPVVPPIEIDAPDGAGSGFGYAVSAGDFDGDGLSESVVSAITANNSSGASYVFAAHAAGAAPPPALTIDGSDGRSSNFGWALGGTE